MKKAISVIAAMALCSAQLPVLAAEESDYSAYFSGRDTINCVAIGGSITATGGTTNSWGSQVSKWLGDKTGKTVNFYNAGIGGTGSDFGIARLYDEVAVHEPDIVFVEFSVNDRAIYNETETDAAGVANTEITFDTESGKYSLPKDDDGNEYLVYNGKKYTYTLDEGKKNTVKRDMEAITRQLLTLPKKPVIIYNYVGFGEKHIANTATDTNRIGRLVMPRACVDVHEEVAQKYGIASINIDSYLQNIMVNNAEALDGNHYTQNEIYSETDCIHPNTTVGTKLYAEYMENVIAENPEKYLTVSGVDVAQIEKYSNNIYDDTFHTVPFTEATFTGTDWKEASYNSRQHLCTSQTGDSMSFKFSGNVVMLRGAKIGCKFNVKITDAGGAEEYTEDVSVSKAADTRYDIMWTKTDLADGEHTITVTRLDYPNQDAGNLAVYGIAVNGEIPEGGFKSLTDFRSEHPEFAKTIGGFESTFDGDLKSSFVDADWSKKGDIKVDVKDGRLVVYGAKESAIYHPVEENQNDIVILSFEATNTVSAGFRVADGALSTNERMGMLKGNAAGLFVRDAQYKATRFVAADGYWPPENKAHKYEIIFNFAQNEQKFFVDGVEAAYTNGQTSKNGKTTVWGTSLGNIYFYLGQVVAQDSPIYLDNVFVKSYAEYISGKIMNLNLYADDAANQLASLQAEAKYIKDSGKSVSAAALQKLATAESEIERINSMTPAFEGSQNNSYLLGARELFSLKDGITVQTITLDGKALEEDKDYQVNGGKYLFSGDLFAEEKTMALEVTATDGKEYLNKVTIKAPVATVLWQDDNTEKLTDEAGNSLGQQTNAAITGYGGNNLKIYQVYADGYEPYVKWTGREAFAGTYKVEWFDLDATIPSTGLQYQQPTMKWEVQSKDGTKAYTFSTTRDDSWHDMGTYTFLGGTDEYIKIQSGAPTAGTGTKETRFFTECIRMTEWYDDNALLSEFATLPESLTAETAADGVTGVAKIITLSDTVDPKYIAGVYVDGVSVGYEVKDNRILVSGDVLQNAREHSVLVKLINGVEANASFALTAPESIDYPLSKATVSEKAKEDKAGASHSRYGTEAPVKVETANLTVPEGTTLDDYVYVQWNIGEIAEGDYLADTWLASGWLAAECKVLVVSEGGEKETVYHSLQAGNLPDTNGMHTEFYFGNGTKIHFTGNGKEYIKIMLDDDYALHGGRCFLVDSVRLTSWYDMDGVYDDFYGEDVLERGDCTVKSDGILYQTIKSNYAMHKYGYTAILAVYDAEGRLTDCVKKDDIMIYDGDTTMDVRFNLGDAIDLNGKTYKVFLWGGDAEPGNDTSMKPYLK